MVSARTGGPSTAGRSRQMTNRTATHKPASQVLKSQIAAAVSRMLTSMAGGPASGDQAICGRVEVMGGDPRAACRGEVVPSGRRAPDVGEPRRRRVDVAHGHDVPGGPCVDK